MTFDSPWMIKFTVLLDMINKSIFLFTRYFSYSVLFLISVFTLSIVETKIIFMVTQQDFLPNHILKIDLVGKNGQLFGNIRKDIKEIKIDYLMHLSGDEVYLRRL